MKILCIAHTNFCLGPHIVNWIKQKEFKLSYCRPFKGDALPSLSEFDWLIIMGGTQCLLELDRYPFLTDEINLVTKAIIAEKIVLGFCLGAQIMGKAMGQPTELSPYKEIGFFPIQLTPDGQQDPLLKGLPVNFPVAHWHRYMPGIPATSKILATSLGCPRQIIRFSTKAYGFQCHPETTYENIQKATLLLPDDLIPDTYVQSKEEFLNGNFTAINSIMITILDNFAEMFMNNPAKSISLGIENAKSLSMS